MAKKRSVLKKVMLIFAGFTILLGIVGAYLVYKIIYQPNVSLEDNKKSDFIYIPTGSDFNMVVNLLYDGHVIKNKKTFEILAGRKKYVNNIKPGRYRVLAKMNNNQLINLLRLGIQEPVKITFNNIRTKKELAERIGNKIEARSDEILNILNDNAYLNKKYGMNSETILCMFLPNTYQLYWNTSAEQFLDRMAKEYKTFWTAERKSKAQAIGFSQSEVATLASIVQAEQSRFNDEKPIIAGLYINRLRKHIPLQSDPTLVYALNDYSITRVLNEHKKIDSPYNTYQNAGLPPGPICLPEISSIDAVLNYVPNDYLYMCAKEDFSGRHYFSKTLAQHTLCAIKYRKALNRNQIFH